MNYIILLLLVIMFCACKENATSINNEVGSSHSNTNSQVDPEDLRPTFFDEDLVSFSVGRKVSTRHFRGPEIVDVIFLTDNSLSMDSFLPNIIQKSNVLIEELKSQEINFQIGVLKTNNIDSEFNYSSLPIGPHGIIDGNDSKAALKLFQNLEHLSLNTYKGGEERPIGLLLDALFDPKNQGTLVRENTFKLIIHVSDANEFLGKDIKKIVGEIKNQFNKIYLDHWSVSSIGVKLRSNCAQGEFESQEVIEELSHGSDGALYPICQKDYYDIFFKSIPEVLYRRFFGVSVLGFLPDPRPVQLKNVVVKKNGISIPEDKQNGFYYDEAKGAFVLLGDFKPIPNDQLEVYFEYEIL